MKLRLMTLLAVLAALATVVIAAPTASAAKPKKATAANVNVPVTGTVTNDRGANVGTFTGDYTINRVKKQGRKMVAIGTVTGVITNTATGATQTVNRAVKIPLRATTGAAGAGNANVVAPQATCEILDLVLGPLDLDLLGLVVHLDTVHLNITAQRGPGNLLGNLLCGIAGALDGGGGGGLANLLNRLLGL